MLIGVAERVNSQGFAGVGARRIGLLQWLLAPLLFLTFMFGPIGWLLFMAVRHVRRAALPAGAAQSLTA